MHFPFFVHKLKKRSKLKYVSSLIKSFEASVHNLNLEESAAVLKKRLKEFLIKERFQLQLMEFEKQIKTHKPDAGPEDIFDLEETIKDFNLNYVDI